MKVIHCFRSPVGGLFRHVCDLVKEQVKQGLQIGIICDSTTGGQQAVKSLAELERFCSLGVHRLAMSRSLGFSDIHVLILMDRLYKKLTPDLIHSHGGKGGAYGRLLARMNHAKAIYTPHGGSLHYSNKTPSGIIYLSLEKALKSLTDGLICESQFSADVYRKKIGSINGLTKVIHNGLQEKEFISVDNKKAVADFVFVGELRKLKGLEVLLQAMSRLVMERKTSLLLYGAGPDEVFFKEQTHKMGLSQVVTFLPPIFPATQAFSKARCVVVPSLAESFPYIVLEAIASKTPTLTTRVGGVPEIFGPYSEHLVPSHNVASLATAMQKVIDEPEQGRHLARLLQDYVKSKFTVDVMVSQVIGFYNEVLDRPVE